MRLRIKNIITLFVTISILFFIVPLLYRCSKNNKEELVEVESKLYNIEDSAVVVKLKKPQNGYFMSFIHKDKEDMIRLSKGDSINLYLGTERLPLCLCEYLDSVCGEYTTDFDLPIVRLDTLDVNKYDIPDIFFMDVNFDGKEDFIFTLEGNGKLLYECYDIENAIVNRKFSVLITPMREEPYCRFASGAVLTIDDCTLFDYKKKEIYIYTTSGCSAYTETWAKYFEGKRGSVKPCVKVVKQERHVFSIGGDEHSVETFLPQGDSLRLVRIEKSKI